MTRSFSFLIIKLLLLCQAITTLRTAEFLSTCCQSVNIDEPCRSLCENPNRSKNLTQSCPEIEQCVELMSRNLHWQGRACCANAVMKRCADGCQISASSKMLAEHCRKSDEFALYSCVETLDRKSACCSYAKTYNCVQICQQMMFNVTMNLNDLEQDLHASCGERNEDVINCVFDNVNTISVHQQERFKTCCGRAHSKLCLEGCKSILSGGELTDNQVELLEQKCGAVNLNVEIWKCFLANESKNDGNHHGLAPVGDLAKLGCCLEKAQSTRCRKICTNVYTYADMNSLDVFYKECLVNATESSLSQCIEEIESPVELGCENMSFCSTFNYRPRQLFRSCSRFSDTAAKVEYTQWLKRSSISLFGQEVLINHSDACLSLLHTFACTLHLKPATKFLHHSQLCYEDCTEIIGQCNHNIDIKICSNLPKNVPCISLREYSTPNEEEDGEVGMPCKDHQCNTTTELCAVDRVNGKYRCSKGACQIGQGSNLLVPSNTFVRVPSKLERGCFQICRCHDGDLKQCVQLQCVKLSACSIGNQTIPHGSSIEIECNVCGCYAGEVTCTKKQCKLLSDLQTSFLSLPCNCPPHFTPVCGSNGKTYPSSCIAKCVGLSESDFAFGSCESLDPCTNNKVRCLGSSKCFANRQVCLSSPKNTCPQHKCLKYELEVAESTFDYKVCNHVERVCGINGVTYASECECIKDFSMVDYFGDCRAIGLIDSKEPCAGVKCPQLPKSCIESTIPTGACCPVCGGLLKIVFSRKQVDREAFAVKSDITVRSVMESLQRLVTIPTCYLAGYLSIESDLVIIVYTVVKSPPPTPIQIDVCREEAIKISNLINTKSHQFSVNLGLSSFIVANYVEPTISSAPSMLNRHCCCLSAVLFSFLITYFFLYA